MCIKSGKKLIILVTHAFCVHFIISSFWRWAWLWTEHTARLLWKAGGEQTTQQYNYSSSVYLEAIVLLSSAIQAYSTELKCESPIPLIWYSVRGGYFLFHPVSLYLFLSNFLPSAPLIFFIACVNTNRVRAPIDMKIRFNHNENIWKFYLHK